MLKILCSLILLIALFFPNTTFARTTPEDILNSQRASFNQRVKNYSPQSKQKLNQFSQKIADLNKEATDTWEEQMVRQGEILDEFIGRNNANKITGADGIHRNLTDPIENARYWLTYAHEAVAYQAAKVYVYNLTSEKNVNQDILSQINILSSDLNILRNKVLKSQQIIGGLVSS